LERVKTCRRKPACLALQGTPQHPMELVHDH
jgi:hypothetical protein